MDKAPETESNNVSEQSVNTTTVKKDEVVVEAPLKVEISTKPKDKHGDLKDDSSISHSTDTQQIPLSPSSKRSIQSQDAVSMNTMKKVAAENTVEIDDGIASIKSHQVRILAVSPGGSSVQDSQLSLTRTATTGTSSERGSDSQSSPSDAQSGNSPHTTGSKPYTHSTLSETSATHSSYTESTSSPKAPSVHLPVFEGSPELSQLATFYYSLDTKYYHSGYVYKLNALGVDGTPLFKDASPQAIAENGGYWSKWWMELVGPVLHLWRVPDELASFGYTASLPFEQMIKNELDPPIEVMDTIKSFQEAPLLINFSDSVVEVLPKEFSQSSFNGNPAPPIPYNCFFSLSTTSSNLFIFASASVIQLNYWVCSIRLAMYELQRLNQLFTQRMLRQSERIPTWSQFGLKPFSSAEYRGDILYEGPLQIRLPYSIIWKQVYAVVTSKYGAEATAIAKTSSKLFSSTKKDAMKEFDPSKRGSILIYESKKAAQKGKMPLATLGDVRTIYAIWPSNSQEAQVKNVSLAKIECSFLLAEPPLQNVDRERTFGDFSKGFQQIRQIEDIDSLISGVDQRPEPSDLLILTSNTSSLTQWIVSILSAFSLDAESPLLEDEVLAMIKTDIESEEESFKWPSQLYLSLDEVGGLSMPRHSLEETKVLFGHYLLQKVMYSKNGKLKSWNQNISKGEWERGLCDRKEMEFKLTFLFNWVEKVVSDLKDNNIVVSKPHPTILVSAMATVMGWLGPVLTSMIGSAANITPVSENAPSIIGSTKEVASVKSISEGGKSHSSSVSSDGDGSVSEEERSDEGSQSEEEGSPNKSEIGSSSYNESYQSIGESQGQTVSTGETKSEESNSPDSDEEFAFYEPNSLLSKTNPSKLPLKGQGPFFDTSGEVSHRESLAATAHIQKRESGAGPLLGVVKDPANKPKLQTGLLGEIERREEETKQLGFRASILPGNRMSTYGVQQTDTTLYQLNTITQRMLDILQTSSQANSTATLDLIKEDVLQMQSIISQGLLKKRTSMYAPVGTNSVNPFAMPTITWSKSNSSKKSSPETSPNHHQKSIESSSMSSSSATSESSSRASKDTSSESESETSTSSEEELGGEEEVPLGEISKRLSTLPPTQSRLSMKSTVPGPPIVIESPLSDTSSESNDRPLSTLVQVQQKRPISFQPPARPISAIPTQLPSNMYQIKSNRPTSSVPIKSQNDGSKVQIPKDNRAQIRAAPSRPNPKIDSTGESSEGSVSDESD